MVDLLECIFRLLGRHINWQTQRFMQNMTLLEEVSVQLCTKSYSGQMANVLGYRIRLLGKCERPMRDVTLL